MIIKSMQLLNFRCFRELEVPFHEQLTVLVAPNGGGKTTILDAVAHILSAFVGQFDKSQWQTTDDDDIRVVKKEDGSRTSIYPSIIQSQVEAESRVLDCDCVLAGLIARRPDDKPLAIYANSLRDILHSERPNGDLVLPIIAYYGSRRTIRPEQFEVGLDLGSAALMRDEGYTGCLAGKANVNLFRTWYGQAAIAELSVQQKLSKGEPVAPSERQLAARARAVKEAVDHILSGTSAVPRYRLDLFLSMNQVGVLDSEQDVELGLHQLSDGVQCMLSMAGDIAARCAVLNPHFGADAPTRTPGIVLIDEVDLHLHPTWQQRIIPDLQRAFPMVQFIVTTHSPQVLTTVHRESIRILRGQQIHSPSANTYGTESKRSLEEVMETPSRPPNNENTDAIRALYAQINAGQLDDAEEKCRNLMETMGADEPALIEARTIIVNRRWEKELGL